MKWKVTIGIVLIVAAVAGMYLWETRFRDEITLTEVLVASEDIEEGSVAGPEQFTPMRLVPQSVIAGALTPADASAFYGKTVSAAVRKNQQILPEYFYDDPVPEGFRHFVIPSDWIYSRSEIIGPNDSVRIYAVSEASAASCSAIISQYRAVTAAALIKEASDGSASPGALLPDAVTSSAVSEAEITEAALSLPEVRQNIEDTVSSMIDKMLCLGTYRLVLLSDESEPEILAELEDYLRIYNAVNVGGRKLLFVMEDE